MENLVYSYILREVNKFSLINNEDEGCYIDNEDEIGCGKIDNGLYMINDSAKQTIQFEYNFDRKTNQFIIPFFELRDFDDNHIFTVRHGYDSFFELVDEGIMTLIIQLWLKPELFLDKVLVEFNSNELIFICDDIPF